MTKRGLDFYGRELYLDEHLSKGFAKLFNVVFGFNAKMVTSELGAGAKDIDIISYLGKKHTKPILFGCDVRMSKNNVEMDALRATKLPYVVATANLQHERFHIQAWKVIRYWPVVMEQVDAKEPCILKVDFTRRTFKRLPYID